MSTPNKVNNTPEVLENTSPKQKSKVWIWILVIGILAIVGLFIAGLFSRSQTPDAPAATTEESSETATCAEIKQWHGFLGTAEGRSGHFEDSQHLNISVVNGQPAMATNKYPVSSNASKAEFIEIKKTGVIGMMTFIKNHYDVLALYGFDLEVSNDYKDYVVQHEDGDYYLNARGCELANEFAEVINNPLVEVRLIWVDRALAELLANANNSNGYVTYSPLVNTINLNMTVWEVKFYKLEADGVTKTEVGIARQLTRCGNLTPPRENVPIEEDPKEEIPQKQAPKVQPSGDDNFAGKPNNPGNPDSKPGVVDQPSVPNQTNPEIKPDDKYVPSQEGGGTYVPPNPEIKQPDESRDQTPSVILPEEEDRTGDTGGF